MAAGEGDLERAPGRRTGRGRRRGPTTAVGEPCAAARRRRARRPCRWSRGAAAAARHDARRDARSERRPPRRPCPPATASIPAGEARLADGLAGHDDASDAAARQREAHRQDARAPAAPRRRGRAPRSAPARPRPARTCSEPSRMPIAIARSSEAPALRSSAGARLTVIRRGGMVKPALRSAPRTRSRASDSAASGRPTIVNPGSPGATSTSTRTTRPVEPVERGGEQGREHGATRRRRRSPADSSPAHRGRGARRALSDPRPAPAARRPRRHDLSTARAKSSTDRAQRRVGLREHERRAGVERARSRPGTR